jgi:hypothetical protein
MTASKYSVQTIKSLSVLFSHPVPTRFVRMARNVDYPSLMIPTTLLASDVDLDELTKKVAEFFSGRAVGIELDFHPCLAHDPVDDIDLARDYQNLTIATAHYRQCVNSKNPRANDVSFAADDVASRKRFCHYSRFILPKNILIQKAKRMYRAVSVTCTTLYDATREQIEESGYNYSPNNVAKGKLNGRFVDSIKSLHPGYVPLPSNIVVFLKVEEVDTKDLPDLYESLQEDLKLLPKQVFGVSLLSSLDILLHKDLDNPQQLSSD